jgi:DNA-directed RNA polymerase specialized sigma24 family protein
MRCREAFATAVRKRHSFRGEGPLEAWVWRIVLKVAQVRARWRRRAESVSTRGGYARVVPEIPSSVVDYIRILSHSRDTTVFAGDRAAYERHLAAAARLVALLAQEDDAAVEEWLRTLT